MNPIQNIWSLNRLAIASLSSAGLLLSACAATAVKPEGADRVRSELTSLQTNPDYASRAPVALQEAEAAVRAAEVPTADATAGANLVFVADRKVAIARAQAEKRYAEDKVKTLSEQRESIRLEARTAEATAAKAQAEQAQALAKAQQEAATVARSEAEAARVQAEQANALAQAQQQAAAAARSEAEAAKAQAEEMRRQMEDLQAKETDRGLVMTLGDVLFATGKAELKPGSTERLNKLVAFLGKYPNRTVIVEGHTDNIGKDDTNQALSQRRADAVRTYLLAQGVAADRVTALGKGESLPVADNDTAAGRQQNRRVEIVISNTAS